MPSQNVTGVIGYGVYRNRQNVCCFAENNFKLILFNENVWILSENSTEICSWVLIDGKWAMVQVMAWHWTGPKPLPESMMPFPVHWSIYSTPDLSGLTHWGWEKMADIFQTTFSNAFSWMKTYEFRLEFHWIWFLRVQLTILQHWLR